MSWYDNIELDDRFILPKRIKYDCDYEKELLSILDDYVYKLNVIKVPKNVVDSVIRIKIRIVNSLKQYYKGNIPSALKSIAEILNRFQKREVIISDLYESFGLNGFINYLLPENDNNNYNNNLNVEDKIFFYKARLSKKVEDYEATDMIHIPFNLREKVASQRFSIPGLPCIYLGTSSYVCWLELDRPMRANFNISAMEISGEFKVLNLVSSWDLISRLSKIEDWNISLSKQKLISELLLMWPLVCATSFKVKYCDDRSFKSEYVISQLLMQVVASKEIDGICYYSKRINDNYAYPHCINLALPAKYNDEESLSEDIQRRLKVRKPVNFEEYSLLKNNVKNSIIRGNIDVPYYDGIDAILAGLALNYSGTEFYEFDGYLRNIDNL